MWTNILEYPILRCISIIAKINWHLWSWSLKRKETENVKVFWGEFLAKSNEEWQIWALDGYEYILKTFCVWQKIKLFWLLQTGSRIHHNFIFDPPTIPPPDLCKCWQVQRNLNNMIREEKGDYIPLFLIQHQIWGRNILESVTNILHFARIGVFTNLSLSEWLRIFGGSFWHLTFHYSSMQRAILIWQSLPNKIILFCRSISKTLHHDQVYVDVCNIHGLPDWAPETP